MSIGVESEVSRQFKQMEGEIQACNCIKFAAYRTASKVLVLQKTLGFTGISLQTIRGVFEQHRIRSTDNHLSLSFEEIENILYDIFYAASKEDGRGDIESSVQLTKLLLKKIFIKNEDTMAICVLNLKVALVCLCSSSLYNKYQYWFSQLMDHNLCLPRRRFHSLLRTLLLITDYLMESNTFSSSLIEPTLETCFTEEHHSSLGITESDFLSWLAKEPQILVWLSTFYRLSISQKVSHDVQCSVCGMYPIVGLRYNCLRCIRYDMCQLCFFTARTSKHHKSRHVIKEYCSKTTFCETTSTFLKEVFKRICGHPKKLQYLPVNNNFSCKSEDKLLSEMTINNKNRSISAKENSLDIDKKIRSELRRIISEIEKESSRLLSDDCGTSTSYLINTQAGFLQECLNRVKSLQDEMHYKKEADQLDTNESKLEKSVNCDLWLRANETCLSVPSPSGFSAWIEGSQHETTYSKQLQVDLENIMIKLNNMLESNFSISDENDSFLN